MKTVFDDKSLLEFFKAIQDVNEAQKELNHITSKRIALLERRINDFKINVCQHSLKCMP